MAKRLDLVAVSSYFNPCNYRSRKANLIRYLDAHALHGIPVYLAELAFEGQQYVVPQRPHTVFRFGGRDVMWHKERLINLTIKRLPTRYTKVAWIDADVLFPNSDWYNLASELLDTFPLVQLFERAVQKDNQNRTVGESVGLAAYIASGRPSPFKFDSSATWPGLAWAARRDLLTAHGLLDTMIVGGADTYMSIAAFGRHDSSTEWHIGQLAPMLGKAFAGWAALFGHDVDGKIGFVPTTVLQLGHGAISRRQYVDRFRMLREHDFDPAADIKAGPEGVWEWCSPKFTLHSKVRRYFEDRQEDAAD